MRVRGDKVLKRNGSPISTENFAIYIYTHRRGIRVYDSQLGDSLSIGYVYQKGSGTGRYVLDPLNPIATVVLTKLDTAVGILSGTFSARLFRQADTGFSVIPNDSMVVRNGRFDMKYK